MTVDDYLADPASRFATVAMTDTNGLLRGQMVSVGSLRGIAKAGMGMAPAQLALDELPGKTYTATLMSVGPVPIGATPGVTLRGVVNYPVIFSLGNPGGVIKPVMTAKLNVQVDRRADVLLIPSGAAQVLGARKFATVLVDGQMIQTPITTGLSNDQWTEVTSGLKEGDAVVLNP